MKYMGGKTSLLKGDLGQILLTEAGSARRFVDLFAGSGAVAHFAAQYTNLPVLSVDLQEYARIFAGAVIERTSSLVGDAALMKWLSTSEISTRNTTETLPFTSASVMAVRAEAASDAEGFITRHYGGHYFSLDQARTLDALYRTLPDFEPTRTVALAALLQAASTCAAAPGHTAQPFQPTRSLLPYIKQAWSRSVIASTHHAINQIAPVFAVTKGEARVGDAQSTLEDLHEGDLVFCDPPYSAVQYSRFYHVLEGIARGGWDEVWGNGRAPDRTFRKASAFSMASKAPTAMKGLLDGLRRRECRVVITFPDANASNGMSAKDIIAMAAEEWKVCPHYVDSIHSTLGGSNGDGARGGRKHLKETVIVLIPKCTLPHAYVLAPNHSRSSIETRPVIDATWICTPENKY